MASRKICIIGSGPAGWYCVESLANHLKSGAISVDIFEKSWAPNGLARHGVAPDHPEMRVVEGKFGEWARLPGVNWYGCAWVRSLDMIRSYYDAVILTYGSDQEKMLAIPGEEGNPHVIPAGRLVSWYNAWVLPNQPEVGGTNFEQLLTCGTSAAVIGLGNVALDIARILLKPADQFQSTDMPSSCVDILSKSTIRDVHLVGRRGPVQSAFTAKELREILKLPEIEVVMKPSDFEAVEKEPGSQSLLKSSRKHARIFDLLKSSCRPLSAASEKKRLHFHFYRSPVEVLGRADYPVEVLRLGKNRLDEEGRCLSTSETEDLPCSLVVPSVGYFPTLLPGLPYDAGKNCIPNTQGRVEGQTGVYVAGWLKRGPQGVIPDNRFDAVETVASLLADLQELPRPSRLMDVDALAQNFPSRISFDQWSQLDQIEKETGLARGKPREKLTTASQFRSSLAKLSPSSNHNVSL